MKKYIKFSILFLTVIFIFLNAYMLMYSYVVFSILVHGKTIFSTGLYESSMQFGLQGKPNSNGFIIFPGGDSIPVSLDYKGERIGAELQEKNDKNGKILFIGDSFSFGDANYYENSFPYLISGKLNMKLTNASMVGYGYAQYLMKIKEKIESDSFQIIAIQVSPHSVERAVNGYLPAFSKIPTPFFCINSNDSIVIHKPRYQTNLFKVVNGVNWEQFLNKNNNFLSSFLNFYAKVGVKIYSQQTANEILNFLKRDDFKRVLTKEESELYFLDMLNKLFANKKCMLIFYNVGYLPDDFDRKILEMKQILKFDATFINMEKPLWMQVNNIDDYYKRFCHWRGQPPVLVDKHYNKEAHSIVSDFFINELNSSVKK